MRRLQLVTLLAVVAAAAALCVDAAAVANAPSHVDTARTIDDDDVLIARNNDAIATADVVILGAGIAGISTARSLIKQHGINSVLLIEARDEVGGRAHTLNLTNPQTGHATTVEKGCNWIQGNMREPITKLAKKWGLKTQSQNYSSLVYFEGTRGLDPNDSDVAPGHFLTDDEVNFTDDYDAAAANVSDYIDARQEKSEVDLTARAALSILDWLPKTPLQKVYEWFNVDFTFAQPPEICSLYNTYSVSEDASADRLVIDQRGYKYIFVKELEEAFDGNLSDHRLHLNTTVRNIDYSGKHVRISTDKGVFVARKHVVVTFSIGVLQDNFVTWTPRLPSWKKEAVYSFAMALYQKVFLLFPSQFWRDEQFVVYADPDQRGRYPLWQNLNAPGFFNGTTDGYIYFVTHVDAEARRIGALTDADVQEEAMFKLRELYGNDIPDPLAIQVPRWDQDPLYRGSYSNWPLGELDQHFHNLQQPVGDGKVLFSGEAYSEEAFGYVQGAWLEGIKTAKRIAKCAGKAGCAKAVAYESIQTCAQTATVLKRSTSMQQRRRKAASAAASAK